MNLHTSKQCKQHSHLVGQRVSVVKDGKVWVGTLSWSGVNKHFGWNQVTLGRFPLRKLSQQDMNSVKLCPKTLFKIKDI